MKALMIGLLALCATEAQSQPAVDAQVFVASQYNFRGVAQNNRGVVQPSLGMGIPVSNFGTLAFSAWGNIDLSDDTGNAALPGGNGGHLSEVDFVGALSIERAGAVWEIGFTSYNFPQGGESTTEVQLSITGKTLGLSPRLAAFYDFDLVHGFYVNGGLFRSQPVGSQLTADIGVSLGVSDSNYSGVYYGTQRAGLADLTTEASFSRRLWEDTTLAVSIHAAMVLDGEKRDALERNGLDGTNVWVGMMLGKRL